MGESSTKIWATAVICKKMPKEKTRPIVENLANLVTLVASRSFHAKLLDSKIKERSAKKASNGEGNPIQSLEKRGNLNNGIAVLLIRSKQQLEKISQSRDQLRKCKLSFFCIFAPISKAVGSG
jgi:hypothetical protein